MNEVRILQQVNHPCVIRLEDVIDTPEFLYIVLELAEGGELFEKIIEKTKFNEAEVSLSLIQCVQEVLTVLYSNLQYEMGEELLDTQHVCIPPFSLCIFFFFLSFYL